MNNDMSRLRVNPSVTFCLLTLFALSACTNYGHYKNPNEFSNEVISWNVIGKEISAAMGVAVAKGFYCDELYCYKDLPGFPCRQRLRVNFHTDIKGLVNSFEIWTINNKLPTRCL